MEFLFGRCILPLSSYVPSLLSLLSIVFPIFSFPAVRISNSGKTYEIEFSRLQK